MIILNNIRKVINTVIKIACILLFGFMVIIVAYSAMMIKIGVEFGKIRGSDDNAEIVKSVDGCRWLVSQKTKKLSACLQEVKILKDVRYE